jgi:putative FmdB family regulatory protein
MPIYEFYCSDCHALFNFFSKTINTDKCPTCPRCKRKKLERQVSLFAAVGRKAKGDADGMDDLPFDESKMEQAIGSLAGEAEHLNEDDPRQAAQLMRKFSNMTGIEYGKSMQDALGRMEAGEDPEKIESEMGDLMDSEEEPFLLPGQKGAGKGHSRRQRPPDRDPTLYEM